MKQMILNLPDFVNLDEKEISMTLAAKLYEEGKLSVGQAAELVGISKRSFIELLGKYNVSLFNYSPDDLEDDVKNA
jgi:predicted HTH domain antitoxin